MIELKDVSFKFDTLSHPILKDLSLTIANDAFVSLVGKSGSGKSTLMKLIAGLLQPNNGEITIDGKQDGLNQVAYMPQSDLLLPWKTVSENIKLSQAFHRGSKLTEEELDYWLERADLKAFKQAYPRQLSGGMRQRVAFLRTLLTHRTHLLLDEPFGALDTFTKQAMQFWLMKVWEEHKKTVLFITHDLEEALLLSDKILILSHDRIESMEVPIPRPREAGIRFAPELIALRAELEGRLKA